MKRFWTARSLFRAALFAGIFASVGFVHAAELDPKALAHILPDQIKWVDNANGSKQSVVVGDPKNPASTSSFTFGPPTT